ncbi:MAG: efflux transporter outer membrane subunit [Sphingobium sp.]|uniref:efflux transporter outer membrane subunit n=1 Tax=Sphingobium sp. TaxID=1912891 RepID=UPI0029B978F7|nr:efflux transporter outer membrane subunit [Sphingobium sp.]MDX3908392.1 efflux transporter outer membrane subunit [Sphingobium sp.]
MRTAFALASTAMLVAGCAAPNLPRPSASSVSAPPGWRTELPAPNAAVNAGWWQGFGDPILTGLVERALAHNPDVAIAAARVQEARANERLARAQLFPTLDVGAGVTRSRSIGPLGAATETTAGQPLFQAAYEVDLFGRIGNQVEAARLTAAASEAARDAAALAVASATASGYVTLLGLDARRAIVRATIASRGEALRLARSRAEAGYTSDLELRQAQAEFEATAQLLPQVDLAIGRQENALSLLVGESPRAIAREDSLDRLRPLPVPEGLPSELLRRRPDLAQTERILAASDRSLAAARAQYLPSIRLTGTAGLTLSTALRDPLSIWSLGASILAPLFEGGRLCANVEGAAARRDQAAFAYQRAALTAFREVDDALLGLDRLAAQRVRQEAQRSALAEALRHATNRYRAGYTTYLEQLDAQRALLSAELSVVQLRVDELNTLITLYQAMGGGWSVNPGE